ncbi:VOC family protein [Acetilactobacillus jinshanensis]
MLSKYFTGIQHVGVPANNLDQTIKFYKSLGFKVAGKFKNGSSNCAFMKYGTLMIETWDGDPCANKDGAINHMAVNCTDVKDAFKEAKAEGYHMLDDHIESIPSYWNNGIKFFKIQGPNHEAIEFCQIM